MNSWINLGALWRIVVIGVLLGAGLPALFAIGLRALTVGSAAGGATAGESPRSSPAGRVIAGICFAAVLAAIGWGIYSVVNQS
jgi:hypothetical protein